MSGLIFACQLNFNVGGLKSNDFQASTYFSLGSSKSWVRKPAFEAYRKISRKLLMRHPIVVLGLTLRVNRCSLARSREQRSPPKGTGSRASSAYVQHMFNSNTTSAL